MPPLECIVTVNECLVSFSGSDVVILNSLLGDRLVISKTDDLIHSYESQSTGTGQGQVYLHLCVCVIQVFTLNY